MRFIFTFNLSFVVLAVAVSTLTKTPHFFGLAIGFCAARLRGSSGGPTGSRVRASACSAGVKLVGLCVGEGGDGIRKAGLERFNVVASEGGFAEAAVRDVPFPSSFWRVCLMMLLEWTHF